MCLNSNIIRSQKKVKHASMQEIDFFMSLFIVKTLNSYTCLGDNGTEVKGWAFKCDDVKVFSVFQLFINLKIWRLLPPFTIYFESSLKIMLSSMLMARIVIYRYTTHAFTVSYWSTFAVIIFKDSNICSHI